MSCMWGQRESLIHLLRDCPETFNLWHHTVPQQYWRKFRSLPFDHWFRWNIYAKGRSKHAEEWSQYFILTWWLWRRCNTSVFEGKVVSNTGLQNNIKTTLASLQYAHSRLNLRNTRERCMGDHEEKWKPPPAGWVKINTDGAFSYTCNGVASGGVFRDEHSSFLKGFMFKGVEGDSLSVELWGCLHGLKLAWDMGYRKIILESDAAEAVELIKQELNELHADRALIEEIQWLLDRDWTVEVNHICRWANHAADYLAKSSISAMPGLHILSSVDMELGGSGLSPHQPAPHLSPSCIWAVQILIQRSRSGKKKFVFLQ